MVIPWWMPGFTALFNGFNYYRMHLYIAICVTLGVRQSRPRLCQAMENDTCYKLALLFIKTRCREWIYTAVSARFNWCARFGAWSWIARILAVRTARAKVPGYPHSVVVECQFVKTYSLLAIVFAGVLMRLLVSVFKHNVLEVLLTGVIFNNVTYNMASTHTPT